MKRTAIITLLTGFVLGASTLFSTLAMAHNGSPSHGGPGMMGEREGRIEQAPCLDETYPNAMPHGYGYGMMGSRGMHSMMGAGNQGHMMDYDAMRHDSVLNQADRLGLSDKQIGELNALHVAERKDIIREAAEADVVYLELSDLLSSDNWTMKEAEELVHKLENIRGEMRIRHIQALHESRGILTTDQWQLFSSMNHFERGTDDCS